MNPTANDLSSKYLPFLPNTRPPIETLERRWLLAADPAVTADPVAAVTPTAVEAPLAASNGSVDGSNAASFYSGRLKFQREPEAPKRTARDVIVNVESASNNGEFAGTITAAGLGTLDFTGQLQSGRQFSATVTGNVNGTLYGELRGNGRRFIASIVSDTLPQIGIDTRAVTNVGETLVLPADGVVGETFTGAGFVGLSQGRGALNRLIDDAAVADPAFLAGRQRSDIALDITNQTENGLLGGTLLVNGQAYNANGFAAGDQLTFLLVPQTAADGSATGVFRVNTSQFGSPLLGRLSVADAGILDTGRVALTPASASQGVTASNFGSNASLLAAILGLNSNPTGGSFSTIDSGIGTPGSTGTEIGSPVNIGTTRIDPIFSGTEIGTPRSTGTEFGTPIYAGQPATVATRSFTTGSTTNAGSLLDRTYSQGGSSFGSASLYSGSGIGLS